MSSLRAPVIPENKRDSNSLDTVLDDHFLLTTLLCNKKVGSSKTNTMQKPSNKAFLGLTGSNGINCTLFSESFFPLHSSSPEAPAVLFLFSSLLCLHSSSSPETLLVSLSPPVVLYFKKIIIYLLINLTLFILCNIMLIFT